MKALIGLLALRGGKIVLSGEDLTGESADRRAKRGVGYVPQGREIFPHMTVADNLRMGRFIRSGKGDDKALLDEICGYFPFVRQRMAQRGGTLSGGQQEMLSIARALNGDPRLFLLDEPSDGVQPSIVQEIGEFLQISGGAATDRSAHRRTERRIDPGGGRAGLCHGQGSNCRLAGQGDDRRH
jgi:branched-chain amino acid transport system ATP-binding protein